MHLVGCGDGSIQNDGDRTPEYAGIAGALGQGHPPTPPLDLSGLVACMSAFSISHSR